MKPVPALLALTIGLSSAMLSAAEGPARDYPIRPCDPSEVQLQDQFWAPRLKTNRTATIPGNLKHLEEHGSLEQFAIVGGKSKAQHRSYMWGDSDAYKTIEGITYSLQTQPDPALAARMEEIIANIIAAQAPDGYLMPHIQIAEPAYAHFTDETTRTCESYSMGHMIESAVAHHRLTGKDHYLKAACRLADLLARVQSEGKLEQISGHPEIELALVKLYRATGEKKYLDLAAGYVRNARTQMSPTWSAGKPFLGHDEARGHAVAATYLYCGATDVAALTGDPELLALMERKWQSMVGRKMFITGGIGLPAGEGYGADYNLPNNTAYAETCAAISSVLWNHRLFLANRDAKYLDVLERTLYNGVLSGLALNGELFCYSNVLETDGKRKHNHGSAERVGWFDCPCCPVNLVRLIPQVPGLLYATEGNDLYVNLFAAGKARIKLNGQTVALNQETRYPWDGRVRIVVQPEKPGAFGLRIRIPGWARGECVPGDLYRYVDDQKAAPELTVNGQSVPLQMDKGFAVVNRAWREGDTVELTLPMPVRRVVAHDAVAADAGRAALQRGPLVYCLEAADNPGGVLKLAITDAAAFTPEHRENLLGGITVLKGSAMTTGAAAVDVVAIPYYAWNHRGVGEMAIWLRRVSDKAAK